MTDTRAAARHRRRSPRPHRAHARLARARRRGDRRRRRRCCARPAQLLDRRRRAARFERRVRRSARPRARDRRRQRHARARARAARVRHRRPATRSSCPAAPSSPPRAAVVAVGATPVVADIDRDSSQPHRRDGRSGPHRAAPARSSRSTSAAGRSTWTRSSHWPRERDLIVIEDCAQAHGGTLPRPAGRRARQPRGRLLVLPGQDHPSRRGRHARARRRRRLRARVGVQGPRQVARQGRTTPSSWPGSTSFKWLVDSFGIELAHGRDVGRRRPRRA